MGVENTCRPTPVGVFFGEPSVETEDPFFGGVGPPRRGCIQGGECLTGCRHNAKNTLLKNYLYLAELGGATVHPLTTVTTVRPLEDGHYAIDSLPNRAMASRTRPGFLPAMKSLDESPGTLGERLTEDGMMFSIFR